MKIIYNINKWSYIITLVLYLTLFLGMYAQIALGFIQIILALIIFVRWNEMSILNKKLLVFYWIIVSTYGVSYIIINYYDWDVNFVICLLVIPMTIATYFVYTTNKIYNQLK